MKRYIAKTNVSINVVLGNRQNMHIAFRSLTGGGSVYETDDPSVALAMERHYRYGTLFRLDPMSTVGEESGANVKATSAQKRKKTLAKESPASSESSKPAIDNSESEGDAEVPEEEGPTIIEVTDPDAAKAYLADRFGISRTKIKSVETIKSMAAANGIEFKGL